MASFIQVVLLLLLGMFSMVNCRFILYDSGDSSTKVDIGGQLGDVKKILADISSKVNALTGDKPMANTSTSQMVCPDGWLRFKGSCYFFDSNPFDFQTAENNCNKLGAYIVRLETPEENHFLKAFMANHFRKDTNYWIGMTDKETEGLWKISGTNKIVPFTDWKGTEPQNYGGNEDCAIFHQPLSFAWADASCSSKFKVLCEKEVVI